MKLVKVFSCMLLFRFFSLEPAQNTVVVYFQTEELTNRNSPGHNQNWIYSDVIELHKMAPTLRDAIRRRISALFSALKCSFPTLLWKPYFE